ncbi:MULTISPECIES: hypothetical protein [Actinomycetes]|uniref:Uncharacterized protein n=2 Tax=Actinomycetes TaxID=1760 RepID=A0ABP6LX01_9MICC|nr:MULTISPECIES: hypothetical protein [unclassified Nesterenkonia]MDS2172807.1 hypothetical protein [Nesterenkonia sp. CL21]
MAEDKKERRSLIESVKAPLIFSAALAFVAGFVTLISASGGTDNPARVDLALIAFGVVFIVALLVVSMLQLASRDNPEHLSQGAGVNRKSEDLYRRQVAERRAEAARKKAQEAREAEGDEPRYGRAEDA